VARNEMKIRLRDFAVANKMEQNLASAISQWQDQGTNSRLRDFAVARNKEWNLASAILRWQELKETEE